jgi:chemotaxis protein methyltransferase CheR
VSVSENDFDFLAARLRERAGFVLEADKSYLLEPRLAELLMRHRMNSIEELVLELRQTSDEELERQFVEAMLNNETTFFRDIDCFHLLRTQVLPEIFTPSRERPVDILCCACSTGQEPYSVAMLLAEAFPLLDERHVRITAIDYNKANLERAERGAYTQFEINRGLPVHMLLRYFEQDGEQWTVRPQIRERVVFREWNLLDPWWPIHQADIVFLRNVMIYWAEHTKRAVLDRTARVLPHGGFLVLGGAETTYNLDSRYERVGACCYRRE